VFIHFFKNKKEKPQILPLCRFTDSSRSHHFGVTGQRAQKYNQVPTKFFSNDRRTLKISDKRGDIWKWKTRKRVYHGCTGKINTVLVIVISTQ
jgi:hypothetical protein